MCSYLEYHLGKASGNIETLRKQSELFLESLSEDIDRFHSRDKNLDNRCYAAILVYQSVNKPQSRPLKLYECCDQIPYVTCRSAKGLSQVCHRSVQSYSRPIWPKTEVCRLSVTDISWKWLLFWLCVAFYFVCSKSVADLSWLLVIMK